MTINYFKVKCEPLICRVVTHIGKRFIKPWLRNYWIWRYFTPSSVKEEIKKVDKGLNLLRGVRSKFDLCFGINKEPNNLGYEVITYAKANFFYSDFARNHKKTAKGWCSSPLQVIYWHSSGKWYFRKSKNRRSHRWGDHNYICGEETLINSKLSFFE